MSITEVHQKSDGDPMEKLKEAIKDVLILNNAWMTIGDILDETPALQGSSARQVSRILTDLKDSGVVNRKIENGKVYFKIMD